MPTSGHGDDTPLLAFIDLVVSLDHRGAAALVRRAPLLATATIRAGSTRADPATCFLAEIRRHLYRGDTALHVAAATWQRDVAELLVAHGAGVRASNRRGAEPLHYAADGRPDVAPSTGQAQRDVIAYLLAHGAAPDARDASGVAAIHRAVRTRSPEGVAALLAHGADPHLPNRHGSTPLHLAVQHTGKSGAGSPAAKAAQAAIVAMLLQHGARPTDRDRNGHTVADVATDPSVRALLAR